MSDLCRRNIRDPPFALILESNKNTYFLVWVCFVWGSRNEKLFSFLKTVIGKLWLISRKMCFRNTINRVYFSCKHNTIELLSLKGIEFVKTWLQRIYIDDARLNCLILTLVPVDNESSTVYIFLTGICVEQDQAWIFLFPRSSSTLFPGTSSTG